MKEKIIYHIDHETVELNNPVMIVGLPGVGHVGKIVVDHLVEELKAEKVADIYSKHFPPQVIVNENSTLNSSAIIFILQKQNLLIFCFSPAVLKALILPGIIFYAKFILILQQSSASNEFIRSAVIRPELPMRKIMLSALSTILI
jgi:Uncharacterized protein (ATP-grasp superfamily)